MPQNGEENQKFGVYQSICCGAEIVINVGTRFPDCPRHPNLATTWRPIPEERVIASHIENRRLSDLAFGRIRLQDWEQHHLHGCSICQSVLYVFVHRSNAPPEDPPEPADAA